jgi:hypothetical protein
MRQAVHRGGLSPSQLARRWNQSISHDPTQGAEDAIHLCPQQSALEALRLFQQCSGTKYLRLAYGKINRAVSGGALLVLPQEPLPVPPA